MYKRRLERPFGRPVWLRCLCAVLAVVILLGSIATGAGAEYDPAVNLTQSELAYLDAYPVLRIAIPNSAAPVVTLTEDGDYEGIVKSVTDYIGEILDVEFSCVPYYQMQDGESIVAEQSADLIMIPRNYAEKIYPDMMLTTPFFTASTVLFCREDIKPDDLEGKICAVVVGDTPPDGVLEEEVLTCENRMDAIEAVHSGRADYGYGNEFSVAYYTSLQDYHNIFTVPIKKTEREYCFGIVTDDTRLLSILNKAIATISTRDMQTLILSACVVPEQPIQLSDAVAQFAMPLVGIAVALVVIMAAVVVYIIQMNRRLKLQNERLSTIAEVSGDLLFEYNVRHKELILSKQFRERFQIEEKESYTPDAITGILRIDDVVQRKITGEELNFSDGQSFKAVYSYLQGENTQPLFLVGKLIDISQEKAELEALSHKARFDGLTRILNATESKTAAVRALTAIQPGQHDALLIIDIDEFKHINDTYGHYEGDQILIQMAAVLRQSFRSQDIVGRLGGDEFMVYMCSVTGADAVREKCQAILKRLRLKLEKDGVTEETTVSIGAYLIAEPEPFESVYQKADAALYTAKMTGKNGYHI